MDKKHRSFPERTYKANILSGGAAYKISPMSMIIDQMKRDSEATGVNQHDIEKNNAMDTIKESEDSETILENGDEIKDL